MPDVSVIVSTYNRAESLRDTIQSLVNQQANGCTYEVIVVDNNSKDHTKQVVSHFNGKVRYFFEPRQGLSYARNTGIQEAKGRVIAFTDDDVVASPFWVASLWKCFQETGALAVGGKIERLWNCDRPEWLSDEISGPLIIQDLGLFRKRWDSKNRHTVGANMAFHKSVFNQYGLFREELGRKGDQLIGGEDREIFKRLFEDNAPIFYEPEAIVAHKVEQERISKKYLRQWFWDVGKTLGHGMEPKWHCAFTIAPLWLWKETWNSMLRRIRSFGPYGANHAEKFASELWLLHFTAMFLERFWHWLPFGFGRAWCTFKKEKNNDNTK